MTYTDGIINLNIISKSSIEELRHPDTKLFLCLVGKIEITLNSEKYVLEKDQILIVNAGDAHSYTIESNAFGVVYYISKSYISKISSNPTLRFHEMLDAKDGYQYKALLKVLKKILELYTIRDWSERLKELRYYYAAILSLMKNYANLDSVKKQDSEEDIDRINFIVNYIHMNYNRQIGLQDLADQLHLSIPYLSKYIKEKLNEGFVNYLNKVRVSHTADELSMTHHSITRIAFDNGFSSLASFNRIFKEYYLETPTAYRERIRVKDASEIIGNDKENLTERLRNYFKENPLEVEDESAEQKWTFDVDVINRRHYHPIWNRVWNLGSADELLRADVQDHIVLMKSEFKIKKVSIWGIFSEEMLIDLESDDQFNFSRLDKVFDFLLQNEMVPLVDIGFHPKELYNDDKILYYKEKKSGYGNQTRYKNLITRFIDHIIQRYSEEIVEEWMFELSKDDRLFLHSEAAFFDLFGSVCKTIKTKLPKAKVGGGAIFIYDQLEIFKEYIENWSVYVYQPDFVSVWIYPYDLVADGKKQKIFKLSEKPDYTGDKLDKANEIMKQYALSTVPLYVTRWNMSLSSRNYLHDSCYKGTYLLKNYLHCLGKTSCLTYCGISDLLCEYYDTSAPLNGANGLITRNAIRKPAYYAMYFLEKMGKYLLEITEHYMMSVDDYNNYFILVFNHCEEKSEYKDHFNEVTLEDIVNERFEKKTMEVIFKLNNIESGKYLIKKKYINHQEGSVLDEWKRLEYKEILDNDEIEYLKSVCRPRQSYETIKTQGSCLVFETSLMANEFQFFQIKRVEQ